MRDMKLLFFCRDYIEKASEGNGREGDENFRGFGYNKSIASSRQKEERDG
jgi:hypothetical protein